MSAPKGQVVYSYTMRTINAEDHPLMRLFHKPAGENRRVMFLPDNHYQEWLMAQAEHRTAW
ncbi:MAG: hypothetical protein JJD98_12515 [Polaromonas sp.]|nr:hypothetical protein [Polaromonas sp.]